MGQHRLRLSHRAQLVKENWNGASLCSKGSSQLGVPFQKDPRVQGGVWDARADHARVESCFQQGQSLFLVEMGSHRVAQAGLKTTGLKPSAYLSLPKYWDYSMSYCTWPTVQVFCPF